MMPRARIIVAGALTASAALAQAPQPSTVAEVLRDVGRLTAASCDDGTRRTGTAFVWPDDSHMVTARHVVAGCQQLGVLFPGGASFSATPARELPAQDLVLLRLDRATGRQPLTEAAGLPPIGSRVAAIGYQLGAPTPDGILLDVTPANRPPGSLLRDMLADRFQQLIRQSGELSLETRILRLNGNLVPGLSGAPLLSHDGSVVGIGSGGLQDGAGGIVWAVRAEYLRELGASPPIGSVAVLSRPSGLQFADQAPQDRLRQVQCGSFTLTLSRTVTLDTLSHDTDDPRGLQQLLAVVGTSLSREGAETYDVWVDLDSGAAVPVPAGAELVSGPVGCMAEISPTVGLSIVTHRAAPGGPDAQMREIQTVSVMLENSISLLFPFGLIPDPAFTYALPITRSDGFAVNRKAAGITRPAGPNQAFADYVFITHMTRGDTYFGVSGFRLNHQIRIDVAQLCMANPGSPQCSEYVAGFRDWASAAAAVHLSTIPPI